ncbi:hypothetical protein ACH3VR_17165 [Microbacterium sp. B2969]|uniref:Methionine/alanine importer small subunit n=1 Tax=Microbacterium alkaliflavum TaxID=3248839 RepID=A0ABW7QB31_9MICO
MDAPTIVLIAAGVLAAWAVIAILVAVVVGRTAAAGDHERRIEAMAHEMRREDAAAAASARKHDAAAADGGRQGQ